MGDNPRLYYIHDPMCSWCWAFRPVWAEITRRLPGHILTSRLLGGLAPDSDEPMPMEMQDKLQTIWRTIQRKVPGTEFNFDFWRECAPRRSTYPACRAVIAARRQDAGFEEPMTEAIQRAYYLQARNPSDASTLTALAGEIGADAERFALDLRSTETEAELMREIRRGQSMGATGFPSLVLEQRGNYRLLQYSYTDADLLLAQLE
jgi:putative protein-disulfide isomerase